MTVVLYFYQMRKRIPRFRHSWPVRRKTKDTAGLIVSLLSLHFMFFNKVVFCVVEQGMLLSQYPSMSRLQKGSKHQLNVWGLLLIVTYERLASDSEGVNMLLIIIKFAQLQKPGEL